MMLLKKIITAIMMASLVAFAGAAAADEAEDALLAQLQANKQANEARAQGLSAEDTATADAVAPAATETTTTTTAATQTAAPAQSEAELAIQQMQAEASAQAAAEVQAAPAATTTTDATATGATATTGGPTAAETVQQLVKEAADQAAAEAQNAPGNTGTVAAAPAETTAPAAETTTPIQVVQIPSQTEEPAPAATETTPVQVVQIPQEDTTAAAAAPAAAVAAAPASSSEIPAGYPLAPSDLQAGEGETRDSLLVTAEWLKANRSSVVLVDARPESLYTGGHIPGAVNAQWTYFGNVNTKQGTDAWGAIWPEATMAKRIAALGIDGKKPVVAYCDAGGWGQSGWTIWILRQAGIKNAKLLEGGITAWKAAGGEVTKNKVTAKAAKFSISAYKPNYCVTTEWVNNNIGKPGLVILDVRTDAEYLGKIRPFQEKRAGHLPGAINIDRESFLTSDNLFKTPEEIQSMLAQYGVTPDNEIVVYDTAGVRSAFVTMALRYSGFLKSMNYDSGFQAWAGNEELPLVKP